VLTTLFVLAALGGGVLYARQRARSGKRTGIRMPARERGPGQLQTHDVVCHLGRDWLVEGVIQLEGGGRRRRLARLVDGSEVAWLLADADELVLLRGGIAEAPPTPPPDTLVLDGATFRMSDMGAGRVGHHGDVGSRSSDKCRYWRYCGPGGRRAWLDEFRSTDLLVGEVVAAALLDVLPGS